MVPVEMYRRSHMSVTPLPAYGPPSSLPAGLDWPTFTAAYFPGQRRHDLEAVVAYGAYRRFHTIEDEPSVN